MQIIFPPFLFSLLLFPFTLPFPSPFFLIFPPYPMKKGATEKETPLFSHYKTLCKKIPRDRFRVLFWFSQKFLPLFTDTPFKLILIKYLNIIHLVSWANYGKDLVCWAGVEKWRIEVNLIYDCNLNPNSVTTQFNQSINQSVSQSVKWSNNIFFNVCF